MALANLPPTLPLLVIATTSEKAAGALRPASDSDEEYAYERVCVPLGCLYMVHN